MQDVRRCQKMNNFIRNERIHAGQSKIAKDEKREDAKGVVSGYFTGREAREAFFEK